MSDRTPEEPPTAPEHDRYYNLTLGSTFKDDSANRLSSLRYEFKPASIDKTRPGSMHKRKDNRVSVEFQNNQPGKSKVVFEGSSEDYKENEAVLIFYGTSFRLERLHRSVKQLRHVRLPGDVSASVLSLAPTPESRLSPVIKPGKRQPYAKAIPPAVPVEVERIDVGEPAISEVKASDQVTPVHSSVRPEKSTAYEEQPNDKKWEDPDTLMEDLFGSDHTAAAEKEKSRNHKSDVATESHIPHQNDSDDEIADVDEDDDEATRGLSAAEALKAQVFSEAKTKTTSSSSSSSSGTSSSSSASDSGSASSSSDDSDGSDVNSV